MVWNGLASVPGFASEPDGATYHADNIRRLSKPSTDDIGATPEANSLPDNAQRAGQAAHVPRTAASLQTRCEAGPCKLHRRAIFLATKKYVPPYIRGFFTFRGASPYPSSANSPRLCSLQCARNVAGDAWATTSRCSSPA